MAQQVLVDYIIQSRRARATDDQIRLVLAGRGYTVSDIDEAFAAVGQLGFVNNRPRYAIKYWVPPVVVLLLIAGILGYYFLKDRLHGQGVEAEQSQTK